MKYYIKTAKGTIYGGFASIVKAADFAKSLKSTQIISQIEKNKIMKEEEMIICVDAIHVDDEGYESPRYTWELFAGFTDLAIGSIILVENNLGTGGLGYAVVRTVSTPYAISQAQHEEQVHPYCRVLNIIKENITE